MINEVIQEIVSARNTNRKKVNAAYAEISDIRNRITSIFESMSTPELENEMIGKDCKWEEIKKQIEVLRPLIVELVGESDKKPSGLAYEAKLRAERPFVNIGAIGAWRQGKSQFLQKLTGLNQWIIPVAEGASCTATSINVVNGSYEGEQNVGIVYHYSIEEMCEILNGYLSLMNVEDRITGLSRESFVSQCSNVLSKQNDFRPSSADGANYLKEALINYLQNSTEYVDELTGKVEPIYGIGSATPGGRRFYKLVSFREEPDSTILQYSCLATKKADVYTEFLINGEHVTNLKILDTPGLGEDRIGVNEIFEKAIREDLDIVFALARIEPNTTALPVVKSFQTRLKHELNGRRAEKLLYYLFNPDNNVCNPQNKNAKSSYDAWTDPLLKDLATSTIDGIQGIILSDNHKASINCKMDNELLGFNADGSVRMSNDMGAIQRFVHKALCQTIGDIKDIDNIHYEIVFKKLNEVKSGWARIRTALQDVSFPTISKTDDINKIIACLHVAFDEISKSYEKITSGISSDISKFSEAPVGKSVGSLFDMDCSSISEEVEISKFVDTNIEKIKDHFKILNYGGNNEFQDYSEQKKRLISIMREEIRNQIKDDEANKLINKYKDKVIHAFLEKGLLGKLLNNDIENDSFRVLQLFSILKSSHCAPIITELIKRFIVFPAKNIDQIEIDESNITQYMNEPLKAADYLSSSIEKVLNNNSHEDNFGKKGFGKYESAVQSFVTSLLFIEGNVKTEISEDDFKQAIDSLETDFETALNNVLNIAANKGTSNAGETRLELSRFYERYYYELFMDDEKKRLSALVSNILENIK